MDLTDGEPRYATGSGDRTAKVWNDQGALLCSVETGGPVLCVSLDGNRLATGGLDKVAKVWQVGKQQCLFTVTHTAEVLACELVTLPSTYPTAAGLVDWLGRQNRQGLGLALGPARPRAQDG